MIEGNLNPISWDLRPLSKIPRKNTGFHLKGLLKIHYKSHVHRGFETIKAGHFLSQVLP